MPLCVQEAPVATLHTGGRVLTSSAGPGIHLVGLLEERAHTVSHRPGGGSEAPRVSPDASWQRPCLNERACTHTRVEYFSELSVGCLSPGH